MRMENYVDILKQHLKTSGSYSLVANGSPKWTMTASILPTLWQNGFKGNKVKVLEWPSQSPDLNPIETFVVRTEKACASKEAYKPDSVAPALSAGMGKNSPNLLWEACGRLPKMLSNTN